MAAGISAGTAAAVAASAAGAAGSAASSGKGGKAPPVPDPYAQADAQFQANRKQANFEAQLNRYTQNNPLGKISWENTGTAAKPNWTQNTVLSPEQQQLYGTQMGTQNALADQAQAYSARIPGMLAGDPMGGDLATRQHVEKGLMERLNPYLQEDRDALTNQLANQGLSYGGEAYQRAMLDQSSRTNDARLAVVGAAGDEMQRGQTMDNTRRNQGLAELGALMQGSGTVQLPTYGGGTTISGGAAPDMGALMNNQYQAQLAQQNAKTAGKNAGLSGSSGAVGALTNDLFKRYAG